MAWVWTVLTSEFFWGVIVGLFLSFAGAYAQTIFTAIQSRRERKDLVKNFCADTIKNLREIVDEMAEHCSKSNVIHLDYLGLLDVEIGVFGRNRENLIVLPEQLRDDIRKFITGCAVRRAEIGNYLGAFNNRWTLADQLQSQGQGPQAQRVREEATTGSLANANKSLDTLIVRASGSTSLIDQIKSAQ